MQGQCPFITSKSADYFALSVQPVCLSVCLLQSALVLLWMRPCFVSHVFCTFLSFFSPTNRQLVGLNSTKTASEETQTAQRRKQVMLDAHKVSQHPQKTRSSTVLAKGESSPMPHCLGTRLSEFWRQAKIGHPAPTRFSLFNPSMPWHDNERVQLQRAKQRRDEKRDRGAGSLPCLPCSEVMKQVEPGYMSNIQFHTHTITKTKTAQTAAY